MNPPADQPQSFADDSASGAHRGDAIDGAAKRAAGESKVPDKNREAVGHSQFAQPDDPTAAGNPDAVFEVPPSGTAQPASAESPSSGDAQDVSDRAAVPAFDAPTEAMPSDDLVGDMVDDANPGAQTVISKRPVAAPEEFYRSMPLAELAEMLEGRQLDHFAVEQMIGGGGMGAVFRGRDLRLDRVVAIKVIPASRRDPETLRRFRQEAQAAARLDHPNIARVYYVGEADRWNYIVFEFIDGVNIRDLVQMEGPLSIDDGVYYCRQVAEALEHARTRDVVHRDIKPSNILVTATGHIKVVDMGLARDTSMDRSTADETASGITLGTFDYISPEQARNPRDADTRSDLYSLGCSLFFMLTGTPPFPEGTALQKLLNHGSQPPPDPRGWREDISDQLHDVLIRLMAKRPAQRYQKPIDLVNDLVLLAEAEGLARAQTSGAFMFTPTVAERSLLEANLPWMVALAFLMGSTLWLQSMQATSGISQLPRITTVVSSESTARAARADAGSDEGTMELDSGTEGALSGERVDSAAADEAPVLEVVLPSELLVVAPQQPADVAPMQWERTVDDALRRAATEDTIREIEIRGQARITEPVVLPDRSLVLRGARSSADSKAELQIDLAATTQLEPCIIKLLGGNLKLQSLNISVQRSLAIGRQGVISMAGAEARTAIVDCQLNALSDSSNSGSRFTAPAFSFVHIGENQVSAVGPFLPNYTPLQSFGQSASGARIPVRPPFSSPGLMPLDSAMPAAGRDVGSASYPGGTTDNRRRLEVEGSVVRLHGGLVALDDVRGTEKLELVVRNSLVVSSRETLFAKASNGEGNPRFVRAELEASTFISPAGFATFAYEGIGNPQLGLNRRAESCAFWSAAGVGHLTLVGARRESLLGNFVLLDFQGQRNAYDRGIEEICQSNPGAPNSAKFGFQEAGTDGWFAERGSEFQVAWPTELGNISFGSAAELAAVSRQTVAIVDDMFQPGVPPADE